MDPSIQPCKACVALCESSAPPFLQPHPNLALEWRREPMAFYFCRGCGASLIRNPDNPRGLWQLGTE